MAYKSLYRTYRPKTFDDVSGQKAIVQTLQNAIKEHKIAHAYLFCGPRGTGKTSVAKLFAKAVNCTGEDKPCGMCENCLAIEQNNHQDIIEIDAASNNGVEEVRDLIEKVKYAPVLGQYKVYIIDEVHMMTQGAFNALLKTLEEPPEHVIFILATTEPHKILPTIISRCQRYDFTKLSDEDMIERMTYIMNSEGYSFEPGALTLIARLANGGMRDALSILEQCLAYNDHHLSENDVNTIYGMISVQDKIQFLKTMISKDLESSLNAFHKMTETGIDIKRLTYDFVDILKDVVVYKNTQDVKLLTVLTETTVNTIVPYVSSIECLDYIDIFMDTIEKFARATQPDIYFEVAMLKISNNDHEHHIVMTEEPSPNIEKIKEDIQDVIETEEEVVEEEDDVDEEEFVEDIEEDIIEVSQDDIMNILVQAKRTVLQELQEKWPIIKRYMANMNTARAASMLSNGKPVAASDDAVVIAFEYSTDVNNVNDYHNYDMISHLLEEVLGKPFKYVAMEQEEWLELRTYFIQCNRNKTLPEPRPITLQHLDNYIHQKKLNEAQKFAIDMFGEAIVELED